MDINLNMIAGLDIGNGYVKGQYLVEGGQPDVVDFPSSVAFVTTPNEIKVQESEIAESVENIMNEMEASFTSPTVKDTSYRIFGRRGIEAGEGIEEFDTSGHNSKAEQDLSGVLVLGSIAGSALKEYYHRNKRLPEEIVHVKAAISLALPIAEFRTVRSLYAGKFLEGTHMVTIHNFERQLIFEIKFLDVQVLAEGAPAQFSIVSRGVPLAQAMLDDVRAHGDPMDGVTAEDILNASSTIGIDIGEGTVNFPVFREGKFNKDVSHSINKGYGTVLDKTIRQLATKGILFDSRKALSSSLLKKSNHLSANRDGIIRHALTKEMTGFCKEIGREFSKLLSKTSAYVEVVYVYGGGASAMKDILYPILLEAARNKNDVSLSYPVLYLDSNYSRCLNRDGLFLVEQQVVANKNVFGA